MRYRNGITLIFALGMVLACAEDPERNSFRFKKSTGNSDLNNGQGTVDEENGAGPHGNNSGDGEEPLNGDTNVPPQGTGMEITQNDTTVAMRNFDQINYTMAALTGVPTSNPQVRSDFLELKSQLPPSNNLREISPAKLSAITKLGARYCDIASQDAAARNQLFPNVNFAQGPTTAFAQADTVAMDLLTKLWGDNLETLPDFDSNVDVIATLIGDMMAGKPNTPATTAAIAMGICTAAISSAPVITF